MICLESSVNKKKNKTLQEGNVMKKMIFLALLMSISIFAFAQFNDLIISEYIEGSSYNKALEIYNGTGNDIDLSNYVILQAQNGGNYDEYTFWMSGILTDGEVYVFAHGSAAQPILDQTDYIDNYICNFNGDDYRGLGKIDEFGEYPIIGPDGETTINISIVDMIGTYPEDPGSGWNVAGVTNATANYTLVRKPDVYEGIHGNDEWPLAAGTNAEDSQWIVYPIDTFGYLGFHGEAIQDPAIQITSPNGGETWFIGESYLITWNNSFFEDNVDIYLQLPVRLEVVSDIPNTGSYEWLIPNDAPVSDQILMVVEDAADGDPFDTSDDFFTIAQMGDVPVIVINEIMYNPSTALGDDAYFEFLELYNPGEESVDMSGCYFIEGIDYTFAPGAVIQPYEYIVLAANADSFAVAFGFEPFGVFSGALGNSGEDILLATADGVEIDYVDYDDGGDWPSAPDGGGPSLELISPELDNTDPANWQASYVMNGTPGAQNSAPTTSIGWGDLQWPFNTQLVVGEISENIYGQVYMDGVTNQTGQGEGITAQVGYGEDGTTPSDEWDWFDAIYNVDAGNNDEYVGNISGMEEGSYDYTYRFIYTGDTAWYYAVTVGNLTVVAAPPEEVAITFSVDMQYQDISPNGVHIAGSFQGWDPAATEMIDEDQDLIYTVTLMLLSGTYHEYKFVNGNAWGDDEANNRSLTVPEEDTVLPAVLFNDWFPVESGVIFSEYIEGSSNNKALEIYNASDEAVSLDNFRIAQSVNGGGWAYWHYFPEGAVLEPGDVWVMLNSSTSPDLFDPALADEVLSYPSVVHHNGDDARGLEYSLDGENWALIDIIGDPDNDPGNGWEVAGVANATQDHTLVRKGFVSAGNTDWLAAAGTDADDSEWIVYPINTFEYLGYHGEAPEFEVVFNVNMTYQIMLGNFDPELNFVDIGGNFNDWGAIPLIGEDLDEDGIYTMTAMLPLGYNCEFKFRIDGNWDLAEFPGGDNRTYTVIDDINIFDCWFNDEETPEFTSQDVLVTFTLNMEYVDPALYAGGISIQGSASPLSWDPGINLLVPARNSYTIDLLFPEGSVMNVDYKFAMLAEEASEWDWEAIDNRTFTIDDENTTQIIPEVFWNDMIIVSIPEIQTPIDETDVSPYAGQIVTTQGIVTATASDKYWLSTPDGGAWSGLYAYDPDHAPVMGDHIIITGLIAEYYGLTEIYQITDYSLVSSGNEIPAPAVITTSQLDTEEQWESVLVQVQDVVVTQEANNYGEWYISDGSGECQVDDAIYHVEPLIGDEFASITGVVNYSYNFFELLPRYEEDLVEGPQWIYGDVTGDWSVDAFDAANMLQFAVQLDPIGAPLPWTWQIIAGDVDGNGFVEAYDAALVLQYSVDLIDVFPVEQVRYHTPNAAVRIEVIGNEIVFVAEGDVYSLLISIDPASLDLAYPIIIPDVMSAVNQEAFALALANAEPLSGELVRLPFDILQNQEMVTINYSVNGIESESQIYLESGDAPLVNQVIGNYPNPFNPVTKIRLAVASHNAPVGVDIYNVKGQLVKSLYHGILEPGIHNLTWNGTDNNDQLTGSGVYFYRVQIADYSSMNKMIMLK
jgi:hypothetical protein